MRLSLTTLLLLLATSILAQDSPDAGSDVSADPTPTDGSDVPAASPTPASDSGTDTSGSDTGTTGGNTGGTGAGTGGGGGDNSLENTKDLTQPWNITYFTYPTRNNYWVNDNENKATWAPVNVPTNLMLSHSNTSMLPQRIMLQQNIPGGVGTFATKITGYTPGNNYLLVLSIAGNPDREYERHELLRCSEEEPVTSQSGTPSPSLRSGSTNGSRTLAAEKLAQSQGFYIKANGTAAPQQVTAQGNQATASAVSNGGSTQPGSGDPAKMQAENASPANNNGAANPSPNAPASGQHSAAARVGSWVGLGAAVGILAAAVVAPLLILA